MLTNQRIVFADNGDLVDKTRELNNIPSGEFAMSAVTSEDFLYVATDLPTTHRYFVIKTANATPAKIKVEIWDGGKWVEAVDVIDSTDDGDGISFKRSGWVRFSVNRNSSWSSEDTTEDVAGLEDLNIYKMNWFRLSWDANITATIEYAGFKFSEDADLELQYSDLLRPEVLTAFKAGKADWDEQHLLAGENIIRQLTKSQLIHSPSQIMDPQQLTQASVHMVASIIYNNFTDDEEGNAEKALKASRRELNQGIYKVDRDEDGRVDREERRQSIGIRRT